MLSLRKFAFLLIGQSNFKATLVSTSVVTSLWGSTSQARVDFSER